MYFVIEDWQIGQSFSTKDEAVSKAKERLCYDNTVHVVVEAVEAFRPTPRAVEVESVPLDKIKKKGCNCQEISNDSAIPASTN